MLAPLHGVVPGKAGTHTPCPLDRLRLHSPSKTGVNALMLGPGSTAGTTRECSETFQDAGMLSRALIRLPPHLAGDLHDAGELGHLQRLADGGGLGGAG